MLVSRRSWKTKSLPALWMLAVVLAGYPPVTIVRCLPDRCRKTQDKSVNKCVFVLETGRGEKKTHIAVESGGQSAGAAEWENESLNDAENWPVTEVHPSGKSLLQLPVTFSVPSSSHPASPPAPHLCLRQFPPLHPDSTSFMTTYSKLPSPGHSSPVAINNRLHMHVCIRKLWNPHATGPLRGQRRKVTDSV